MYKKEKKEHAFKSFSRDISSGTMPPVLFLYGEEGYLIHWAVESLRKRYVNPGCLALDYVRFQEDTDDLPSILEACNTFSMLSERRIVWADEFPPLRSVSARGFSTENLEQAEAYLEDPNPGTILVFSAEAPEGKSELVKLLKRKSRCYGFSQLDYSTLCGFISKRFAAEGASADRDVVREVIDQSGYFHKETEYRLYNLVNDIRKIAAYCSDRAVTAEAVGQVLNGDMDTFIFDLLDAVSSNQKDKAFALLHNILQSGRDVHSLIAMLVNQFELMLMVAELKEEGMNLGKITDTLHSSEYRTRKAMSYTEKFTVERLKRILSQIYEVDRNIKTGLLDPDLALELLIGRI